MSSEDQVELVFEGGPDNEQSMPILEPVITLGRQNSNDVVVAEVGVSRQHAEIASTKSRYYLRDLSSTNGTFVNGTKIGEESHLLEDGDKIRLGASKVLVVFRAPVSETLAVTMVQETVEAVGASPATMITPIVDPQGAAETTAELYEGTVQLKVTAEGGNARASMGLALRFTQNLRQRPEFRLLRLTKDPDGAVDVWLGLRQPTPLRDILRDIEDVAKVSPPAGRDLSPGSDDAPLTVVLKVDNSSQPESS
jgi:pSer/pThr/pTyr-binding forkhead associated (FHA) protein